MFYKYDFISCCLEYFFSRPSLADSKSMPLPKVKFQNGITTAAHYASTLTEGSFIEFTDTDAQSRIMLRAYGFYMVNQTENGAVR